MADTRTLLAAVLGVGLGLLLLAFPEAVIRAQLAGRTPSGRGGEYGSDRTFPKRWTRLVQALGVACILLGGYIGAPVVL